MAGEAGGVLALPGGGVGQAGDLQQLMVAGYGHYVDGRGECPPVSSRKWFHALLPFVENDFYVT